MGYSNVELANQALDHIGKDRIASLSENSVAGRKVTEIFTRVLYAALSESHWSFARKIATLANVTNDWDERWGYKYDLPSDCLTFIRVVPRVDPKNAGSDPDHQLMGGAVYTNEINAKAEYVAKSTATLTMPDPFLEAVSYRMARDLAMPLTRKSSLRAEMSQAYLASLARAVMHDAGQERTTYDLDGGQYIEARGNGINDVEGAAPDGSIYWT